MAENMWLFNSLRETPQEARKTIPAGRLKGFTDINPMWRLKRLTELFGPCGQGWKYEIVRSEIVPGANNEAAAFVEINLYYKQGERWSDPIPGVGGSMLVQKESGGLRTNDECYKMALTDAIGTACKALGMSADIFFEKDRSKYIDGNPSPADKPGVCQCSQCGAEIKGVRFRSGEQYTVEDLVKKSDAQFGKALCWNCLKAEAAKHGTN